MKKIITKIFNQKKLSEKEIAFLQIKKLTKVSKIFKAILSYNDLSDIRFVGGCVRKILNYEKFDDIDLATNLNPKQVKECLENNNINFYETGINHGTITANIEKINFEITSLRKDISTDGRHAVVEYTNDWSEDAHRRDFTINSIYADLDGNLFDPHEGSSDLKKGIVKFIGEPEKRIKEDYLRILRYVRFFLNYSKKKHQLNIIKIIKKNIKGITNLSKERLLNELQKLISSRGFVNISKDKSSKEILLLIFPQLKNLGIFNNLNKYSQNLILKKDFTFILSLLLIDETDNCEYFFYKFNVSNQTKDRINFLKKFYINTNKKDAFSKKNLKKILYYHGITYLIDLIDFQIFKSKKENKNLVKLKKYFEELETPKFPVKARTLMQKYNIKEGKELGEKLKYLEILWVENNFKISEQEIDNAMLR